MHVRIMYACMYVHHQPHPHLHRGGAYRREGGGAQTPRTYIYIYPVRCAVSRHRAYSSILNYWVQVLSKAFIFAVSTFLVSLRQPQKSPLRLQK